MRPAKDKRQQPTRGTAEHDTPDHGNRTNGERLGTGVLAIGTGARKKARQGATSNGSACRSGRMHLRAWTRQAEPRRSRPIGADCCLADRHERRRLQPMTRFFPRPSIRNHLHRRTARDGQHREWGASPRVNRRTAPGERVPRDRARPSRAVLRLYRCDSLGCRVSPCPGGLP